MSRSSNRRTELIESNFDDGRMLPTANEENKLLIAQNKEIRDQIQKLREEELQHADRIHAIIEHKKNVRQELQQTQGMVESRKKQMETEMHMKTMAEREEGRLAQEIRKMEKDLEDLKERMNLNENNIFRQTQRLQDMKAQMNWDQQALEAWLEESAHKDDDAMIIEKYKRQDEAKIRELTLKMNNMNEEASKKKHRLDNECITTATTQMELDKTAEEFRKAHMERQDLIAQWQLTIENMQRRDREMDELAIFLSKTKGEVREKEAAVREKSRFLENEVRNNRDVTKAIENAESMADKYRTEYRILEKQREDFQSEFDVLTRTVERTSQELEATRRICTLMKKDIQDKQDKLVAVRQTCAELDDKLRQTLDSKLSAEERTKRLEEQMAKEERVQRGLEVELKQLRDVILKKTEELAAARDKMSDMEALIQGTRSSNRNISSKIVQLDNQSLKQQEILYNQDFNQQVLERRLNRMSGEVASNEEQIALENRKRELETEYETKQKTHSMLVTQMKRVQDDIRWVKRNLDKNRVTNDDLNVKLGELELHDESSNRLLKKTRNDKHELMADENILKLEVKRLRDALYRTAGDVLSLEKQRLQLETAMRERTNEINVHVEMLKSQVKFSDQDRQQVKAELHERISTIEKLKKKFEIVTVSMQPPDGEEERGQSYFIIKAAQEKEAIQRKGDELDSKIRTSEKEIRALENTIRVMHSCNDTYRKSFLKVTDNSDEMDEKQQLDEQFRATTDKLKYKKRQVRELQEDLQAMTLTLDNLSRDEDAYKETFDEKQVQIDRLERDIQEQQSKIDRATNMMNKYMREIRSAKKATKETEEERDIEVRELRDLTKNASKYVGEAIQRHPEIAHAVHLYFTQANLPPPPVAGTGMASRVSGSTLSSARSSVSSLSSVRSAASGKSGISQISVKSAPTSNIVNIGADMLPPATPPKSRTSSNASSVRR